ncbi:glycosyltransferase family 4 protein [Paenarthrobacter aurescens]|uniref:Putative glycosyl transferase n=1 Tax=Paenarthrobacter aurescens TaxID=43663 RepID=A0A4Y3NF91_PAEAU|nr:glycosyltransferase family 4 protein [Paenarthrobacter aurescens]MDO6144611.1 glycosyltransferase family 4 protein [Paenarthrobacter aurescens]MDO6148456.1 glycosyltransferase family 4 protein [Paenarthrobacter aurescens]MDO6159702.1 glycosyltransferase family 4 protein [Paenarthrobacter aurescens]MDO6164604.1 glycosyltransferase family 4 protein [Paenarthrobacter aurescens]GEB17728.1 putative glycosyl transferase [Paenarthrobacter aurescens]
MRVLHLGFEDPRMPGAGGGSVRTHEINRRLAAAGFDITVLTTRYPGWQERVEDGVRYVPIGWGQGSNRLSRLLAYIARLPFEVRRHGSTDLVVEDFFAPFSTMAAPLWTKRPTIGVVQWLHARDKARQYKLPLHWIERWGVRRHHRLITVSQGISDRLTQLNPALHLDLIGNGVDPGIWETQPRAGNDVLFVGRLEYGHKGLDLLLEAWALCCDRVEGNLLIAGTGQDEDKLRSAIHTAGLSGRVKMLGWLSGEQKHQAIADARLLVVPSRHETFGLVAIDAMGAGTPVIAFDIPCLREIVPKGTGWLVKAFDVRAMAEEIALRYEQPDLGQVAEQGREFAALYNWDSLAGMQAEAYNTALAELHDPKIARQKAAYPGRA